MNKNVASKPMGTLAKLATLSSPTDARMERLPLDDFIPDPNQPRKIVNPVDGTIPPEVMAELREFADDIDANGQLQPILYRVVDGKKMIIAGERRWRAIGINRDLGRENSTHINAIRRQDLTAEALRLAQLAENLQRSDLTDIETAKYIKAMLDDFPDLKKKDIGTVFHKGGQYVSRILAMLDPQWADVISSGAIQFASLLEQFRPLPEKQKAELRELAKSEQRALTSGDIRAAKARAEAEAAAAAAAAAAPAAGGDRDGAMDDAPGEAGEAGDRGGEEPVGSKHGATTPTSSSPSAGQVQLDVNLAHQVSEFLAASSPEGEMYQPSTNATAGLDRPDRQIQDTGGEAVIPAGPAAMSHVIHEKREVRMTLAQLEKLLSRGALEGKGHQVSVMLPVDEVRGALTRMGVPLPEDDSNAVLNLLEAVNKM